MSLEKRSFVGGVQMNEYKELTSDKDVLKGSTPQKVIIPLQQHIGMACDPIVEIGEHVKTGQKIGEAVGFMSVPVHSSITGNVTSIRRVMLGNGMECDAVEIESDGSDELAYTYIESRTIDSIEPEDIANHVKECGIMGLGGATFPTHIKLSPPEDKLIDTVIINGAECEPYLTADQKIMELEPEKVVQGLLLAMKAVNAPKGFIAIEDNKPRAIEIMSEAVSAHEGVEVAVLKTKYPQGDEKRIIDAVTKRIVPSGGLPMDIGVVVINAYTAHSVAEAVLHGKPLYERMVTVTGHAIANPVNIFTRIGVTIKDLMEQAGGFKEAPGKVVVGGPMMGDAQATIDTPVTKGLGGFLVMTKAEAAPQKVYPCLKCGKCVDICPVFLQPLYLQQLALNGVEDKLDEYHIFDCIECGSCSYICPSRRPLVEAIRLGKRELKKKAKKNG